MSSPDVLQEDFAPDEVTELYGGDVKLYFNPENHVYATDPEYKNKAHGVTNIVKIVDKPFLIPAAVKVAIDYIRSVGEEATRRNLGGDMSFIEVMKALDHAKTLYRGHWNTAAAKGTQAHKWVENHIKGIKQPLPEDQEVKNACFAYFQFIDQHQPRFILSESKVYSKKYNYAGTLDFTARVDGELILGDFKTSKVLTDTYFMETAARIKARKEEFPRERYKKMMLVRLGKDGKCEVKITSEIDKYFKAFLAALTISRTFNKKG